MTDGQGNAVADVALRSKEISQEQPLGREMLVELTVEFLLQQRPKLSYEKAHEIAAAQVDKQITLRPSIQTLMREDAQGMAEEQAARHKKAREWWYGPHKQTLPTVGTAAWDMMAGVGKALTGFYFEAKYGIKRAEEEKPKGATGGW